MNASINIYSCSYLLLLVLAGGNPLERQGGISQVRWLAIAMRTRCFGSVPVVLR